MTPENDLRENLFSAEPVSPERQQRFRQELAEIVEPRLPRTHRLYYKFCFACLVIGLPGAACGLIFDAEHRWIWGLDPGRMSRTLSRIRPMHSPPTRRANSSDITSSRWPSATRSQACRCS